MNVIPFNVSSILFSYVTSFPNTQVISHFVQKNSSHTYLSALPPFSFLLSTISSAAFQKEAEEIKDLVRNNKNCKQRKRDQKKKRREKAEKPKPKPGKEKQQQERKVEKGYGRIWEEGKRTGKKS